MLFIPLFLCCLFDEFGFQTFLQFLNQKTQLAYLSTLSQIFLETA